MGKIRVVSELLRPAYIVSIQGRSLRTTQHGTHMVRVYPLRHSRYRNGLITSTSGPLSKNIACGQKTSQYKEGRHEKGF